MKPTFTVGLFALTAIVAAPVMAQDNFADSVVYGTAQAPQTANLSLGALYSDPTAALGQPTTLDNDGFDPAYHRSLVDTAYGQDLSGNNLLVALPNADSILTLKFNTPIVHNSGNWFGQDFIVFGNQGFIGQSGGFVDDTTNLTQYDIAQGGPLTYSAIPTVSVSEDDINFVTLPSPVAADGSTLFPENPYAYNGQTDTFGALNDFTKPVNPALPPADFAGVSAAQAISLYNGSAGGTAFSLAGTGLNQIQYVRFTGTGVVDAVSRVSVNPALAAVPEPGAGWLLLAGLPVLLLARRRAGQA